MVKDALRIAELEKLLAERTAELIQQGEELAVINSVQEALVKEMDMQAIYDLVGNKIQELFDAQAVIISTFDHENGLEQFQYTIEDGERFYPESRPINKLRKHLIEYKQKILINTSAEAQEWFGKEVVPGTKLMQSGVFVPLVTGDIVTSYVSLQNVEKEYAFSDSEVRLLETLANSMSTALQNARLLKETEQRTAELAVINSVQEGLAKELDIQAIYDLVGNRIRELFDAQVVGIATFDHEKATEHIHYLIEKGERYYPTPKPINSLRRHIITNREKLVINKNFATVADTFGIKPVPGTQQPKSAVYVPMLIGDKITGYVSLQNIDKENAFSESDLRLLETLANTMGVALENARLFDETTRLLKETEQQKAELGVINSVQEGLAKELDMQAIYDLVGDRIRALFNAQAVIISTFDHDTATEHFKYLIEDGQRFYLASRPYDKLRQHLIVNRQKIVINTNYEEAYAKFGLKTLPGTNMTKSGVFVPLIIGDKVNSYISLQNNETENAFSESDIRLLETLANSMSVALENARLFDETTRLLKETEQRTAELAVINSVQEGLARELDMNAIYDLVGNKIRDVFDAQAVVIATFDHENGTEKFNYLLEKGERYYAEPRRYDKLRYQLIMTKHRILINDDVEKAFKEFGLKVVEGTEMPKSLLYVPLVVGNKVTSYVSLQNVDKNNAFSDADVRLLETLANSMSVALENARLFDETTRLLKETEQRTAELAVINSVQEGLAKELDMQGIYNLVGDRLCELFPDTQTLVIRTFDYDSGIEHFHYAIEKGTRLKVDSQPFIWASKHLIQDRKPIHINENYLETSKKYGGTGVTKGQPPKSAVFVPMMVGDIVKGSISLQNVDKENAFTESDLRLLTTLTNSMSVALENARLFDETNRLLKETEQRTAELAVINSVQDGLVREMDMQAIYDLVGNRICELFDTQTVLIRTFDHETGNENWRFVIEKGKRYFSEPRPLNWANKQLIDTKQPLLINENYVETARKFGGTGVSKGQPPKSAMFVPMVVGDVVRGSVSLQNIDRENAFTESDMRLLTTLTNSMSVALENARLFDETTLLLAESKQRAAELSTVNSISKALASQLNADDLIKMVGDQLKNLFKANIVYLALLNSKTNIVSFPYQYGDNMAPLKLGEGLTSRIIMTGEPILINKDLQELREQMGIQSIGVPAASYLGVPIP
ncbi:MAG: GAF domain-containing protein, partial [Chitinophagaceae bacterium]